MAVFTIHAELDEEDGGYTAWCDEYPGIVTDAGNMWDAVTQCIDLLRVVVRMPRMQA